MPKFFPAVLCLGLALAEQRMKVRLLILIADFFLKKKASLSLIICLNYALVS